MKNFLKSLILWYQKMISPLFPPSCRFHPSCSQYGLEALEKYGVKKGLWLLLKRLMRCHPFHKDKTMQCDPVP